MKIVAFLYGKHRRLTESGLFAENLLADKMRGAQREMGSNSRNKRPNFGQLLIVQISMDGVW